MGWLQRSGTGRRWPLETETLAGRSHACSLRLPENYVSSQHACIRWSDEQWFLKDLGSRNGTFLNDVVLQDQRWHPLQKGDKIAFGSAADEVWRLVDAGPPQPMVLPMVEVDRGSSRPTAPTDGSVGAREERWRGADAGEPAVIEEDSLLLRANDRDAVTLLRDPEGLWWLEPERDEPHPLVDQQAFEVGGRLYRFCLPGDPRPTERLGHVLSLPDVELCFRVARDEEHVELDVRDERTSISLGSRAYHYLLLHLARCRRDDRASGLPEPSCGWIYQDQLSRELGNDPQHINVEVFRIRRHLAKCGVQDAMHIIERRPRTRQLRLGVASFQIERL